MTGGNTHWKTLWRIFHGACDQDEKNRDAYLDHACISDPELRRKVEALLDAHQKAQGFLETPPDLGAMGAEEIDDLIGKRVGVYSIQRRIGGGGMGVVYAAEQEESIKRTVAVKLIKLGMDSKEIISRFHAERQTLALMRHPNIAQVYDAGVAENGRPFFVMEFVEGEPLDQYCDQAGLMINDRLKIFISLCEAVHHAHQKGIIHRDLKPSNILITEQGGKAEVKIIDFGIAKAIHGSMSKRAFETGIDRALGTPEYMSPEQTQSSGVDIDTRTDIYSLGVILYRLLVGGLPYESDSLSATVERPEPIPPSRGYAEKSNDSLLIAKQRQLTPATLMRHVRGELDWVVVKSLELDRERRYDSAYELATDLRRHLTGQVVEAGAPSRLYRIKKFTKRNRIAISFVSALSVAIISGASVASVGWLRALDAERDAKAQTMRAEATNDFLTDLLEGAGPSASRGRDTTILLDMAEAAATRLEDDEIIHQEVELAVRRALGVLYLQLAQYDLAKTHLEDALEISTSLYGGDHLETAYLLSYLGARATDAGDFEEARTRLESAIAAYQAYFLADGSDPSEHSRYNRNHTRLAELLLRFDDFEGAEENGRIGLQLARSSSPGDLVNAYSTLARVLSFQDKVDEARGLYEASVKLARESSINEFSYANTLGHYGSFLNRIEDYEESEKILRECLALFEKISGPKHDRVARALNTLALAVSNQGRYDEAHELYVRTLSIQTEILASNHPDIAKTYYNMGNDDARQGRFSSAAENIRRSLSINKKHYPESHGYIIEDTVRIGSLMLAAGDSNGAAVWFDEFLSAQDDVETPRHWRVVESRAQYAGALVELKRYHEARQLLKRALDDIERYEGYPKNTIASATYTAFAALETATGNPSAAAQWSAKKANLEAQ